MYKQYIFVYLQSNDYENKRISRMLILFIQRFGENNDKDGG